MLPGGVGPCSWHSPPSRSPSGVSSPPWGCCCSPKCPQPVTRSLPDEAGVPLQLQDKLRGALGAGVQQDLQHLARGTRTSHSCPLWSGGLHPITPPVFAARTHLQLDVAGAALQPCEEMLQQALAAPGGLVGDL